MQIDDAAGTTASLPDGPLLPRSGSIPPNRVRKELRHYPRQIFPANSLFAMHLPSAQLPIGGFPGKSLHYSLFYSLLMATATVQPTRATKDGLARSSLRSAEVSRRLGFCQNGPPGIRPEGKIAPPDSPGQQTQLPAVSRR